MEKYWPLPFHSDIQLNAVLTEQNVLQISPLTSIDNLEQVVSG